MAVVRSLGTGRYHTGEADFTIVSNTYNGGGPLVVVVHGVGVTHANYLDTPAVRADLEYLADRGCVVVVPNFEGNNGTWGTDGFLTRVAEVRTYAAATWDADLTRLAFIGDSAGAMGALNYHWRNPSLVRCTAARTPVVAADTLHDRDAFIGSLIDTAYGSGAAWDTAKPNRDPSASTPAALIAAFASDVQIWYSTNDPTVIPADITTFTALTGVRAVPLGAVGHDLAAVTAAVHADSQAAWIWDRLNN